MRRTKIVATLGPSTDSDDALKSLLLAGVDLVRINFSHGGKSDHLARVKKVRDSEKKLDKVFGIIADLQGPKIRIAKFIGDKVTLQKGKTFTLDSDYPADQGNEEICGIDYKALPNDVRRGDVLLLDDGRIVLEVTKIDGNRIICKVIVGGELSNSKGINRQGGGLSAKSLTEKDKEDLAAAVKSGVDYIAVSFPRCAKDIVMAKSLIEKAGGQAGVIAKIERKEAIDNIDEIIDASDAVMVARGDLGVEIGDAELPAVQKKIIQRCRAKDKAVITATQMMESMITNAIPTRAEVFDVANAVLDGTDAVMLSAETAAGKHPSTVVEAMSRICIGAESHPRSQISGHRMECQFQRADEAVAMATMYTANHLKIKGIVALTESGSTPLWMSRIRSGIPIYALTRHEATMRRVTLYRGVYPVYFDITKETRDSVNIAALDVLMKKKLVQDGEQVILTKGDILGVHGGANAMKILTVGKVL